VTGRAEPQGGEGEDNLIPRLDAFDLAQPTLDDADHGQDPTGILDWKAVTAGDVGMATPTPAS